MVDVFISYKREEKGQVEAVADALKKLDLEIWFDDRLRPGVSWDEEIERNALAARSILVCWSPDAVESTWVKNEARLGLHEKKLAGCALAPLVSFKLPLEFSHTQCVDLAGWADAYLSDPSAALRNRNWQKVLERIGELTDRAGLPSYSSLPAKGDPARLVALEKWVNEFADDRLSEAVWSEIGVLKAEAMKTALDAQRAEAQRRAEAAKQIKIEAARRAREDEERRAQEAEEAKRIALERAAAEEKEKQARLEAEARSREARAQVDRLAEERRQQDLAEKRARLEAARQAKTESGRYAGGDPVNASARTEKKSGAAMFGALAAVALLGALGAAGYISRSELGKMFGARDAVPGEPGSGGAGPGEIPLAPANRNTDILAFAAAQKFLDDRDKRALSGDLTSGEPLAEDIAARTFNDCPADQPDCVYPVMIAIPAGSFNLGSPAGTGYKDEQSALSRRPLPKTLEAFAASRTEITVGQFRVCVRLGGCSWEQLSGSVDALDEANLPVANVTWKQAQDYASWLSRQTDKPYRLLTETEWEYAAEGGRGDTAFSFPGDEHASCDYANGRDISAWPVFRDSAEEQRKSPGRRTKEATFAAVQCDDTYPKRAPVGSKKPNAFGLFDMHGNVNEWVQDCYPIGANNSGLPYAETHSATGAAFIDPANCKRRGMRGGSFESGAGSGNNTSLMRTAARNGMDPLLRQDGLFANIVGFRVARDLTQREDRRADELPLPVPESQVRGARRPAVSAGPVPVQEQPVAVQTETEPATPPQAAEPADSGLQR